MIYEHWNVNILNFHIMIIICLLIFSITEKHKSHFWFLGCMKTGSKAVVCQHPSYTRSSYYMLILCLPCCPKSKQLKWPEVFHVVGTQLRYYFLKNLCWTHISFLSLSSFPNDSAFYLHSTHTVLYIVSTLQIISSL